MVVLTRISVKLAVAKNRKPPDLFCRFVAVGRKTGDLHMVRGSVCRIGWVCIYKCVYAYREDEAEE